MTNSTRKHNGIFIQIPPNSPPEAIEKAQYKADSTARQVDVFWRTYSRGFWDVDTRAYVIQGIESCFPPAYARNDIAKFINSTDMGNFEPDYFHVLGGVSSGYCGQGDLNGNRSVTYQNAGCGAKSTIHELGHNYGLHHSSTLKPDTQAPVEYGDGTSVMGMTQAITGLCSPQLVELGLASERSIKTLTVSAQVILAPIEIPDINLRENEYQHVILGDIHLSIRQFKAPQYPSGQNEPDILYVHSRTSDHHAIRHLADLRPGDSREVDTGVVVNFLEYKNETALIEVVVAGYKPREKLTLPTGLAPNAGRDISAEHSGSWFDPLNKGQGLNLHIKNGRLMLYWYTFGVGDFARRFFFGVCDDINDGHAEFKMFSTEDGTWADPTLHKSVDAGTARLYFTGDYSGHFMFDTPDYGRGSFPIRQLTWAQGGFSGAWYQKDRNGEGASIDYTLVDGKDFATVYWFTYGPKVGNARGNQKQRWFTASGFKQSDGTYNLKVYQIANGLFMSLWEVNNEQIGTATLTVVSDTQLDFEFDINAANGQSGKGVYHWVPLF